MPKGFTEDGKTILSKDEFVEMFAVLRGFEKNISGEWELMEVEEQTTFEPTEKTEKKPKIKDEKPKRESKAKKETKPKKEVEKTNGVSKDNVIEKISEFLTENNHTFTLEKASFLISLDREKYELKIVKKSSAFEFDSEFTAVKDTGKQKIIKMVTSLTFCQVGVIDSKGAIGFTDSVNYVGATITKKRK